MSVPAAVLASWAGGVFPDILRLVNLIGCLPLRRSRLAVLGLLLALPAFAEDGASQVEIFADLEDSGLDFVHFNGMTGNFYMAEINCGGGGVFDYDNDGDLDLYLVQGAPLPVGASGELGPSLETPVSWTDRLYRNDLVVHPDGTRVLRFTDVTEQSGDLGTGYGFGVAAGDVDNDGWVDLYVTNLGSNQLLHNNGDGTFRDATRAAGADDERWSVPASLMDYDDDGWLDLYVGNYLDFDFDHHKVCRTASGAQDYCGPAAYRGVPDRLLRNRGDGTFEDVSVPAGIQSVRSKSLGVVAVDLDGDGRIDFYVANDLTPNQMWIQGDAGRFTDEALFSGSAVNKDGFAEASMGVDAADFDGDGDVDLFMTHLVRETNTLFVNDGAAMFEDETATSGLGLPSYTYTSWGTASLDYDNDGWLEMMIANGAVRVIEALAGAGDPYPFHERNQLFHNLGPKTDGDGSSVRFEDVTEHAGRAFERSEVSRALAVGDLDNDGDTDVLLVNNNGPARVLINQLGQDRHWLGLRLIGGSASRDMHGARVALLRAGRQPQWRRVRTDGSFAAANDPRVLFGLGAATDEDRPAVRVHWPGGLVEEFQRLGIDRYTTLRMGNGRALP